MDGALRIRASPAAHNQVARAFAAASRQSRLATSNQLLAGLDQITGVDRARLAEIGMELDPQGNPRVVDDD